MHLDDDVVADEALVLVKGPGPANRHTPPLAVGETVYFIEGSPPLTILSVNGPDYVTIAWRNDDDGDHVGEIAKVLLRRDPVLD